MFRLGWASNFLQLSQSLIQLLIEPKFTIHAWPRVGQAWADSAHEHPCKGRWKGGLAGVPGITRVSLG